MSKLKNLAPLMLVAPSLLLFACAPLTSSVEPGRTTAAHTPAVNPTSAAPPPPQIMAPAPTPAQLPVRFQQPAFLLRETRVEEQLGLNDQAIIRIPLGSDISTPNGPVPLRDILRRIAALHGMSVTWASDVNQRAMVDVDLRADDDFFAAIDNILRQLDYFHEIKGQAIHVRYRETRRFQIAMPFITTTYSTGVGGDVLGAGGDEDDTNMVGNIQIISDKNKFDVWASIRTNLDQILGIWEQTTAPAATGAATGAAATAPAATGAAATTRRDVQAGKGFYSIDMPVGMITVTAPRPLLRKIEDYLTNLNETLFRQVTIEAKIVEVTLAEGSVTGIDWAGVLSGKRLDFQLFGPQGIIYSPDRALRGRGISQIAIGPNPFRLLLDAIGTQGTTNVLANPKVSVLNGQPALISVGETRRYISQVETTVSREGIVSTSVTTDTVMSGLGLAILPTITDNNEIVLSLAPVTSQVEPTIDERTFAGLTVQLPTVNIRKMHTIVRVADGDTLMIGGLIDSRDEVETSKVPLLGDLPVMGRIFRHDNKRQHRTELVILLRPQINRI